MKVMKAYESFDGNFDGNDKKTKSSSLPGPFTSTSEVHLPRAGQNIAGSTTKVGLFV